MTTPTVLNEAYTTPNTSVAASISVTMPGGSGGRVYAIVGAAASSSSTAVLDTTSTGWTKYAQWTNGNEQVALFENTTGGGTLSVTSTVSVYFNPYAWRVDTNAGIIATETAATGTSTNPNPPLLDQFYSRGLLVRAFAFGIGTTRTTAPPTGYTGGTGQTAGNALGVSMDLADKTVTATSEDPGTFTKASTTWLSLTIAHWDGGTDWLAGLRAKLQAAASNLMFVFIGDSLESSADPVVGGGNTQTGAHATAKAVYFADGLTAMKGGKGNWFGSNGAGSSGVNLYDPRRVLDAALRYTDQDGGPYTLGGGGMYDNTSGQKQRFSPGAAWTSYRNFYLKDTTYTGPFKVSVNGGTQTTLTGQTAASGAGYTDVAVSGSSSGYIDVTSQGSTSGYFLGQDTWDAAVPQMSCINMGFYGCTSTQIGANTNFYDAGNIIRLLPVDGFDVCMASNDTGASIPLETSKWMIRRTLLRLRANGGQGVFSLYPYLQSVTEASTDATNALLRAVASEQCVVSLDMTTVTGCTSRAAMVSSGYALTTDNHPTASFRQLWADKLRALIDPGPPMVGSSAGTSTATATGSAVKSGAGSSAGIATALAVGAALIAAAGNSAGTSTVTGVGTAVRSAVGTAAGSSGGGGLWTEANYPAGVLVSYHDPSNASNITHSSGKISADADTSGNGYTDVQATSANQPAYVTNALNGYAVEDFGFASGQPYFTSTMPANPSVVTFMGLLKWNGASPSTIWGASTSNGLQLRVNGGELQLLAQGVALIGASSGAGITSSAFAIVAVPYNKTTGAYSFRVNGTVCGSGSNAQALGASTTVMGTQTAGGGEPFNGLMSERGTRSNTTQSDSELWEGYVAWKYGLQGNLDAAHPYKSAPPTAGGGGVGAAIIAAAGSASGIGTATGAGNASAGSVGASSGFSTASGVSNTGSAGVGSSVGTSSASAIGASTYMAAGSSAGISNASAVSAAAGLMVGTSNGTSTASAAASSISAAAGSSAGTSSASAFSSPTATASGVGTSAGTSSASGDLRATATFTGAAAGSSNAAAYTAVTFAGAGSAAGSSAAAASGNVIMSAAGSAAGTSNVSGQITALRISVGQSFGTSYAAASSISYSIGTGTATGTSSAIGAGASSRPPDPAPPWRTVYVSFENRAALVGAENRTFIAVRN